MGRFWIKWLLIVTSITFFSGCTPSVSTQQLDVGVTHKESLNKMISEIEKDTGSQDEMWYWLNLARMYQVQKEYRKSIDSFGKAEEILDEYENRASISFRNMGSGIGSTLFSKGSETYYGKGYERTLMHSLNSINYAMLGNFEGATVEMRKMEKRQEFWLKESESNILEAKEKNNEIEGNPNTENMPAGYSMAALLEDDEVRNMVNNYQDAFSYSLSSIVSKISNDLDYSEISKKRAIALAQNADILFAENKLTDEVEVYVVVLSGQAPAQTIEKIRFPFPQAGYIVLDLPSLSKSKMDISNVFISSPNVQTEGVKLLKTDKMAYKTLKDEFPIELTKSIVRGTTKGLLSKQAYDHGGILGSLVTTAIMDLGATAMEKSYRNWEMLPNSGFLSKVFVKRGEQISIRIGGKEESVIIPAETKNGNIILVSYLSDNNIGVDNVQY